MTLAVTGTAGIERVDAALDLDLHIGGWTGPLSQSDPVVAALTRERLRWPPSPLDASPNCTR